MINKIKIIEPTVEILEASIRNNLFYHYVFLFAWIGFLLYGIAYKDGFLWLDAIMFLMAAIGFRLMQKIDSGRLESLKMSIRILEQNEKRK